MIKERKNISNNLISIILCEMDQMLSQGLSQSTPILIEGFITKAVAGTGSGKSTISLYTFTDKSKKNSIKCLFNHDHEPTIDESYQYPITIAKYYFDLILTSSPTSNELQSNLLLIIETYSMPSNDFESGQFLMKPPTNINNDNIIKQKSKEVLDMHIKKILNEYHYKQSSLNAPQVNFLTGVLPPPQKKESVFDIACDLFSVKEKGLLIVSRKGIEYPYDYFIEEEEATYEQMKSLNWKALYENSTTLIDKTKEGIPLFQPSAVDISELKGKKFEKEKKAFLSNKTNRDTTTKEEKEQYPKEINNLINTYGDLQANIGLSTIQKYVLYKKYMGIKEQIESK